jgi:WD40 repeat protein
MFQKLVLAVRRRDVDRVAGLPIATATGASIALWDQEESKATGELRGHGDTVRALAYAPDGDLLVSGGDDRTICLWCPVTRRRLRTITGPMSAIVHLRFSANGLWFEAALGGPAMFSRAIIFSKKGEVLGVLKARDLARG